MLAHACALPKPDREYNFQRKRTLTLKSLSKCLKVKKKKKCTWEQGIPNLTDRMDAYFNWYAEAYRSLQDSKTASLKDSLQKANEKWKAQEVPKTKTIGVMWLLMFPPHSFSPEYSHFTNSLSELPFYSKETIRELAFKIKNSPRSQTNLLRYLAYLGQRLNLEHN